ncbi:hypothetical protein BU23DRAFT_600582 [Bimuria novae-zelandiae CBS 107.79]|uniref:Uncharacterized protein n=1 Tax=Bimuria novae-zelandiae CBS 107.79 TaxID=1447943 RepID=A0A6A5V7R2_9PLEO|nr:hypothetical protein BU23DRAFT_600582 [Bimuria novae-zelandiae CBS 107.79]
MAEHFKRTDGMGVATPHEAAPAYNDVIHLHEPANSFARSSSGYATVPQTDIEHDAAAHTHTHSPAATAQQQPQETPAQTSAGVVPSEPHVHCEECEQKRRDEYYSKRRGDCIATAFGFFVLLLFVSAIILGIVAIGAIAAEAKCDGIKET